MKSAKASASATETRRDRRKRETRERILEAAIASFLEQGYEETTIDAIAERADVARATVFNHYADKGAFLSAYVERRRARVRVLLESTAGNGRTAADRLRDAMDTL